MEHVSTSEGSFTDKNPQNIVDPSSMSKMGPNSDVLFNLASEMRLNLIIWCQTRLCDYVIHQAETDTDGI